MKKTVKNLTIRIISFLMIGIVCMLIVNKAVFLHTHKLSDGTIIEHAHPYNKSQDSGPFKTHHHSNAQFFFLKHLNILFPVLSLIIAFALFINKKTFLIETRVKYLLFCIAHKKGRAPPVL